MGGIQFGRALFLSALAALAGGASLSPSQALAGDGGNLPRPPAVPTALPEKATPTNLDEFLAYVEGEYITRRMMVRSMGERSEDQSAGDYERTLRGKLLQRVLNRVMVKAASRFGLEVRPDVLDAQVEEAARNEVNEAREREEARKPGSGASITFEKVLADRGQTMEEYKELLSRQILVAQYWHILEKGVPGQKRPQVDLEPAPAELKKLYTSHRAEFDQQAGVRMANFVFRSEELQKEVQADYAEAVAVASTRLAAIFADVANGILPEAAGRAHGLKPNYVKVSPQGTFIDKGSPGTKAVAEWLFDPARAKGDSKVVEVPGGLIVGYLVIETRKARPRTYEEVLPDLIGLVKSTRQQRFKLQHMLECLSVATIQPSELAEALENEFRDALKKLDADSIQKDIRLR